MKGNCLRGEIHLLACLLPSCQLRNFPCEFTEKCFAVFDQWTCTIYLTWKGDTPLQLLGIHYSSAFYTTLLSFIVLKIFGFNWTSLFVRYFGSISRFERFVQPCWAIPEKNQRVLGHTFLKNPLQYFSFLLYSWKFQIKQKTKLHSCKLY